MDKRTYQESETETKKSNCVMPFTEADMKKLGLAEVSPGKWEKVRQIKGNAITAPIKKVKVGRPSKDELPVRDYVHVGEKWCKIIFAGLTAGLNHGLMGNHWAKSHSEKKKFIERVKNLCPPTFAGQVKVTYTRFSAKKMDWDNLGSSAKFLLDACVSNKVIEDDNPDVIVEFITKQEKSRIKDSKMEILIEQL